MESLWWDSNFFSALAGGVVAAAIAVGIFKAERRSARKDSAVAERLAAVQGLLRPLETLANIRLHDGDVLPQFRDLRVAIIRLQLTIPYQDRIVRNWLDYERQWGTVLARQQVQSIRDTNWDEYEDQEADAVYLRLTEPFVEWVVNVSRWVAEWQLGRVPVEFFKLRVQKLREDHLDSDTVENLIPFGEADFTSFLPEFHGNERKQRMYTEH